MVRSGQNSERSFGSPGGWRQRLFCSRWRRSSSRSSVADEKKLSIWTDSTDYVVAESAEAARTTVMHSSGVGDEDLGPLSDWKAIGDSDPFPWQEEEGGPKTMIPAAEAVRRLVGGGPSHS